MIDLLHRAIASPLGITALTNNVRAAKAKLYALRHSNSPSFDDLTITESPINPTGEVWIYRKSGRQQAKGAQ